MRFDPRLHRIVAVVVEGDNAGQHFHLDLPELEAAAGLDEDARNAALNAIYDIIQAKGPDMTRDEFLKLDENQRLQTLADGLAALRTKIPDGPNLTPIEQGIKDLQAAVATLANEMQSTATRVGLLETAILSAGGT